MRFSQLMLMIPFMALMVGCPTDAPPDDQDAFGILVSQGFVTADRVGVTTTDSNQTGAPCRFTSLSPDVLMQDAFFPAQSNHRLTLAEPIAGLRVRVVTASEIVLWIRFGQNNFCNLSESNEISRGSWSAGDYDIFIGSPTQGEVIAYVLEVIE